MPNIYKLKDIAESIPDGGRIVAMVEHGGVVVLATEKHVFRGKFETGDFEQVCFRMLEEIKESEENE